MHGNKRSEMLFVLAAISAVVLGMAGLAIAVAVMRPRPFPRPFVLSSTTTTTEPTTTIPLAQRLGTPRFG